MSRLPNPIPFVQARWYTPTDGRNIRLIVIHSMEAPEKGETAENVARYFSGLPETRKASAHYCIDNNSIVQCVQCKDVAYGAPGANRDGLHLEHAGYARQTMTQWLDPFGREMLQLSAELVARALMPKFSIPALWLSPKDVRAGQKGITSHANITKAYPGSGTHADPGDGFPVEQYMAWIREMRGA